MSAPGPRIERGPEGDMDERVVLVDHADRQLGTAPKLAAHRDGRLHRAVSVFLFDRAGNTLLQRRARTKYHSGGLWSNTCCGHPRPGELTAAAARRRLREEMGIACVLRPTLSFTYRAVLADGLIEHEVDQVFVGYFDGVPQPNPAEVEDWRWVDPDVALSDTIVHPQQYTVWFPIALAKLSALLLPSA